MSYLKPSDQQNPEDGYEELYQNQKKCQVCEKSFHFRKRVICAQCDCAFCTDHCCKEIATVEGTKIICDNCYHNFRKLKLQEQHSQEIELLNQELKRTREAGKRVERDLFDKTSEINAFEQAFSHEDKELQKKIHKNQESLAEFQKKMDELYKIEESLTVNASVLEQELKEANKLYIDADTKLEEIRNNILLTSNTKMSLSEQLFHVREKIKYCLDYEKIGPLLCERCRDSLKKAYSERVNKETSALDDSSMSMYESPSILDSVREMKESLNALIVEPEQQAKCVVV